LEHLYRALWIELGPGRKDGHQMQTAWVITREGTRHVTEVLGIRSARESETKIKGYIEWLYALLHCGPIAHLEMARYNYPENSCRAENDRTNTGVPVSSTIRCGHNPYLVATLAKKVALLDGDGEQPFLTWTLPDRIVCDEHEPHVIAKKVPGLRCQAPLHLPLRPHAAADEKHDVAANGDAVEVNLGSVPLEQLVLASMARRKS
jgi:hypothetical protein